MHPEIDELRQKLKEILYDCAVEIRATKAALFLYNGHDRFELASEYGFRSMVRQTADFNDPVVDRCGRGRTPFFINGMATEPRFSELLYHASTDRLLAAPIYLRGQLVGVIDMRDKASKQPFEQSDVPKAQKIADRIAILFTNKNVFGHRFITLSEIDETVEVTTGRDVVTPPREPAAVAADERVLSPTPPPVPARSAMTAPAQETIARETTPTIELPRPAPVRADAPQRPKKALGSVAELVLKSRTIASTRVQQPVAPAALTENDIAAGREVLRSILLLPGAVVAGLSAFGHLGNALEIASKGALTDEALSVFQSKLNIWLKKQGEAGGFVRPNVQVIGSGQPAVGGPQLVKILTAPVTLPSFRGIYLTIAFDTVPERSTHELLAAMLGTLQLAIEQSSSRSALTDLRWRAAQKLLEPDFVELTALRRHCDEVVARSEQLARHLGMSAQDVENVRLVALLHDSGMRLLDYEALYRRHDLSNDELGILREHPAVGAALVEPLLGAEIARAVLFHHERWDGAGYPSQLAGDEIPLASRVVQICDAYVAMTDADSYQQPHTPEEALATIANAAGRQFDPELVKRFIEIARR